IAGGKDVAGQPLTSAEIYNPVTGVYTVLSSPLPTPVWGHTATGLNDGTVLLAGGTGDGGLPVNAAVLYDPATDTFAALDPLSTAELYDPVMNSFTHLPALMSTARSAHTGVRLLHNGKVLLVGGTSAGQLVPTTDVYDPVTSVFRQVGSPITARQLFGTNFCM